MDGSLAPAEVEVINPGDPEAIAEAIVPYFPDDTNKSRYLSYRACGFTVTESIKFASIATRTLRRWRADDDEFRRLDTLGISELRKSVGDEFLEMEFRRNYRLILQADYNVISKQVRQEILTNDEHSYLLKARAHYTPQQLETLERILGEVDDKKEFDFTSFVLSLRGRGQELHIAASRDPG